MKWLNLAKFIVKYAPYVAKAIAAMWQVKAQAETEAAREQGEQK